MKKFKFTLQSICFLIAVSMLFLSSCSNYVTTNEQFIERLNSQIKASAFEKIYDNELSNTAKTKVTKSEFVERMKAVTAKMKEVDESLSLQRDEKAIFDKSIYRDDNFAYRKIEKNGKKLGVNISIDTDSEAQEMRLLDLCIFSDNSTNNLNLCATEISKS